jgi:hypothetical protein
MSTRKSAAASFSPAAKPKLNFRNKLFLLVIKPSPRVGLYISERKKVLTTYYTRREHDCDPFFVNLLLFWLN